MKRIRILFYKAAIDGRLLDNLIAWWTWLPNLGTPPYSHVELQFIDRGVCFSSARRGKFTGVRFESSDIVLKNKKRWDYIEKTISAEEEIEFYKIAESIVGALYDYWGILGFITNRRFQNNRKWYCSECVAWAMVKAGRLRYLYRVSPRRFSAIITREFNLMPQSLL